MKNKCDPPSLPQMYFNSKDVSINISWNTPVLGLPTPSSSPAQAITIVSRLLHPPRPSKSQDIPMPGYLSVHLEACVLPLLCDPHGSAFPPFKSKMCQPGSQDFHVLPRSSMLLSFHEFPSRQFAHSVPDHALSIPISALSRSPVTSPVFLTISSLFSRPTLIPAS